MGAGYGYSGDGGNAGWLSGNGSAADTGSDPTTAVTSTADLTADPAAAGGRPPAPVNGAPGTGGNAGFLFGNGGNGGVGGNGTGGGVGGLGAAGGKGGVGGSIGVDGVPTPPPNESYHDGAPGTNGSVGASGTPAPSAPGT